MVEDEKIKDIIKVKDPGKYWYASGVISEKNEPVVRLRIYMH